ncbi:response regulator [Nitrincola sp. A-D6]|uniref:response regulator n=1 Tax=Nitrincola sp. A-D6 TaxID=1545442 RepID=UPI002E159E19
MNKAVHLLIVDDDVSLCELLSNYLSHEGFQVSLAHSAEAAQQWISTNQVPDLIILDIMMPGKSGLELLQTLRPAIQVPVVMLTGRGDDIDRILGLEMGLMIICQSLVIRVSYWPESVPCCGAVRHRLWLPEFWSYLVFIWTRPRAR